MHSRTQTPLGHVVRAGIRHPLRHRRAGGVRAVCARGAQRALAEHVKTVKSTAAATALAVALGLGAAGAGPALANTAAETGACVISKCQSELARCITDEKCLESLVCLNSCEGKPDKSGCQIRCGDLYSDEAVGAFNTCAVTKNKCVSQIPDDGEIKVPSPDKLVQSLNTADMDGRWYIASGLNKLFDIFDCQVHYFTAPEPGKFYAKLNWRVSRPNGQFYERSDVQTFEQDPNAPGILYNHDNEFLHYQDDWYIAAFDPNDYMFVYYRGSNDAWDGYGGAVIYSRTPELNPASIPVLRETAERLGLDYNAFTPTDNTCKPAPPLRLTKVSDLDTLLDDVVAVERGVVNEVIKEEREVVNEVLNVEREVVKDFKLLEQTLEEDLVSFSRGFTVFKDQTQPRGAVKDTAASKKEMAQKSKEVERAGELLDSVQSAIEKTDVAATKKGGLFGLFGR